MVYALKYKTKIRKSPNEEEETGQWVSSGDSCEGVILLENAFSHTMSWTWKEHTKTPYIHLTWLVSTQSNHFEVTKYGVQFTVSCCIILLETIC